MKKIVVLLLIAFTTLLSAQSFQFYDKNGLAVTVKDIVEQTSETDVVFFGEFHGDSLIHHLEFEYLRMRYENDETLIISMEMFERDTQQVVNQFLNDRIEDEAAFMESARAWPNYLTDYKPIVDFAKDKELQVLAANIPRRLASQVKKSGYDSIARSDLVYVAEEHKVINDRYYDEFIQTMQANMAGHGGMPIDESMLDALYAAQCIKDDTMAEAIAYTLDRFADHSIIHYNGDFHSRYHLGTAQKFELLNPKATTIVISPVYNDNTSFDKEFSEFGDYILVIEKQ